MDQKTSSWANKCILACISIYQVTLSPDKGIFSYRLKGKICAHTPHCSEYAKECFQNYGFWKALDLSSERIMSCTPSSSINHDPSRYRIVFCSGAAIGIPFLEALESDPRFDLVGVMTPPDKASGRGMKVSANKVKKHSLTLDSSIPIQTPRSLRLNSKKYSNDAEEASSRLEDLRPDFLIVVAYGYLLPKHILDIPKFGAINVHGSLLPVYRGASPLQSAFLASEKESGVTIMLMDEGLDTGDMLSKLKTTLPLEWTVKDLINWIQEHAPDHLLETVWKFGKGQITPQVQNEEESSHCGKIEKEDGLIDPNTDPLTSIYAKYQGYALWPKIYFEHKKIDSDKTMRIIIEELLMDKEKYKQFGSSALIGVFGNPVGELRYLNPAVKNIIIKPEGKKAMSRDDFTRGYLTK